MQKQINPDLFGIEITPPSRLTSESPHTNLENILRLEQKISDLKLQITDIKEHLNGFKKETQMHLKNFENHINQIIQSIKILEKNDHLLAQQTQEKNQFISSKLHELKTSENKIKEMIDHHHMMIRSYDLKIQHLNKLIQEKEHLILSYQTSLNEAKAEISRLKKA